MSIPDLYHLISGTPWHHMHPSYFIPFYTDVFYKAPPPVKVPCMLVARGKDNTPIFLVNVNALITLMVRMCPLTLLVSDEEGSLHWGQ